MRQRERALHKHVEQINHLTLEEDKSEGELERREMLESEVMSRGQGNNRHTHTHT